MIGTPCGLSRDIFFIILWKRLDQLKMLIYSWSQSLQQSTKSKRCRIHNLVYNTIHSNISFKLGSKGTLTFAQ